MKKSEKTKITVSKITGVAMNEFGTNGYIGGTINNICKSGINKGLIYHNFTGKDGLYLFCLKKSCDTFTEYIRKKGGEESLEKYMSVRMEFFKAFPNEAHIFFEALLMPQSHLSEEISEALDSFNKLNESIYKKTVDTLVLRKGITKDDALSYFHLMQTMFNGYFSSPLYRGVELGKRVKIHEENVMKLFDFMLYGIAEERE
ncbi:MAG: TetR/AcrR family transcriptional regulator [Eubacteriales bacterium]